MTWILWAVVVILIAGGVGNIARVGKEREALTPGVVAVATVVTGLIVWAIIAIGIY